MSLIDKVVAAVTPPESDEARREARAKAQKAGASSPWLAQVLEHHMQIEDAFLAIKSATDAAARRRAEKALAGILTAHSIAEESVLYPALALHGEKSHATAAYTEQSAAKIQMAALEDLDPMSQDYMDKLEHIRGAVAHHVYEEEGTWFLELCQIPGIQQTLEARYMREFERYFGGSPSVDEINQLSAI
jgi:hypothetical protein